MNKELYDEAVRSNVLSKALISTLLESMNYSSISFINWTVEVLKVIRTRLERGDKIIDEVSGITYDLNSFHKLYKIIYVFLTIFLYLLKCPQSLILSALRAFCFCGKPHISRSIFLYFRYQSWLKSW